MRRLRALALVAALTCTTAACGGEEPAAEPESGTTSDDGSPAVDDESEEPTQPARPEERICAALDLPAVGRVLGARPQVRHDLVKGDQVPVLGVPAQSPQCTIDAGEVTAELIVNDIARGATLLQAVTRQVDSITSAGFLDCSGVARAQGPDGQDATFHSCQSPQPGLIAAYNVAMTDDWGLTCTVARPQTPAEGRRTAEQMCDLLIATVTG